jgi:hypothetical protein
LFENEIVIGTVSNCTAEDRILGGTIGANKKEKTGRRPVIGAKQHENPPPPVQKMCIGK